MRLSLATNKLIKQNSLWTASGTARMLSTRMHQQASLWSLNSNLDMIYKSQLSISYSSRCWECYDPSVIWLQTLQNFTKDSWLSRRSLRSYGGCGCSWYCCSWNAMLHSTIVYKFPATTWLSIFSCSQGRFCHWEMVRTCFRKNNMPFSRQVRKCQGNRLAKPPQWTVLSWTPLCYFTISHCILGKGTYQQ